MMHSAGGPVNGHKIKRLDVGRLFVRMGETPSFRCYIQGTAAPGLGCSQDFGLPFVSNSKKET